MVKKKAQFAPPPFIAPFGVPGAGPPGRGIPQPGQAQLHGMPPGAMPPGMMPGMHPGMMMPWVWQVPGAWFGFGVQGGHQLPNMGPGLQPGHGLQLPMPGSMPGHQDSRSGQINLPSISAEVGNQRHEYVVVDTTRKENNRDVKVQVAINKQIYEAITHQFGNLQANIQKSPTFLYFRGQETKPPKQIVVMRLGSNPNAQEFKVVLDALWYKLDSIGNILSKQAGKVKDENVHRALEDVANTVWSVRRVVNSSVGDMNDGLYTLSNIDSTFSVMKILLASDKIDQETKNSIHDFINILSLLHSDGTNISGYQSLLLAYRIAGKNAFSSEVLSALVSGDSQQAAKVLLSSAYRNKTDEEINNALAGLDVNKFVEEYGEKLQSREKIELRESSAVLRARAYHQKLQETYRQNLQYARAELANSLSKKQTAAAMDPDQAFYITDAWFSQFSGIGRTFGEIMADENKRQKALEIINGAITRDKMAYNIHWKMSDQIYNSSGLAAAHKSTFYNMTFIDGTSGAVYDPTQIFLLRNMYVRSGPMYYERLSDIYYSRQIDDRAVAAAALHYTIRYNPGMSFATKTYQDNDGVRRTIITPIHITARQNMTPEEYVKSVARAYISHECNNNRVSEACKLLESNNLDIALQHSVTLQKIISDLIQYQVVSSLSGSSDKNKSILNSIRAEIDRAFKIKAISTDNIDETTVEAYTAHELQ